MSFLGLDFETSARYANIAVICLAALGTLIGALAYRWSNEAQAIKDAALEGFQHESRTKLANLEIEAAGQRERAAKAESELLEIKERAAVAEKDLLQVQNWVKQRSIPPEQLKRLIEALRAASPKGAVSVSCIEGDAEGCRFADQFLRALRAAGWPAPERVTNMVNIAGQGVVLIADPNAPPDHLEPLVEALASVGLPTKVDHDPKFRSVSADPILLAVFSKP